MGVWYGCDRPALLCREEHGQHWNFEIERWLNFFKWGLIDHLIRRLENSSSECDVDSSDSSQEILKGKTITTGLETILVLFWQRMWLLFYLSSKSLPKAVFKILGLMTLAKQTNQGSSIDCHRVINDSYADIWWKEASTEKRNKKNNV